MTRTTLVYSMHTNLKERLTRDRSRRGHPPSIPASSVPPPPRPAMTNPPILLLLLLLAGSASGFLGRAPLAAPAQAAASANRRRRGPSPASGCGGAGRRPPPWPRPSAEAPRRRRQRQRQRQRRRACRPSRRWPQRPSSPAALGPVEDGIHRLVRVRRRGSGGGGAGPGRGRPGSRRRPGEAARPGPGLLRPSPMPVPCCTGEVALPVGVHQMRPRDATAADRLRRAPVIAGCASLYFCLAAPLRLTGLASSGLGPAQAAAVGCGGRGRARGASPSPPRETSSRPTSRPGRGPTSW